MKSEIKNKKSIIIVKTKTVFITIILISNILLLTGCSEQIKTNSEQSTNTYDIPFITGDIDKLEIINYSIEKKRIMRWDRATQKWVKYNDGRVALIQRRTGWLGHNETPWDFDITNITTNLTKRKTIYLQYVESNESKWELDFNITDEPYTQYKYIDTVYDEINQRYELNTNVISKVRLENDTIWYISGIVKNIGNNSLNYVNITVNFYDENNTWLANETNTIINITSNEILNFNIKYNGKFSNYVRFIRFEVDAYP